MNRAVPAPGRPSRARRRRQVLVAPAVQLTAALALAGQAHAAVTTPIVSGLSWRSGATTSGFPCLADLRARPLDAQNLYLQPPSFDQMVTNSGTWVKKYARKAPLFVVSMALLPAANKGQFAQCAAGAFDGYFRQVGTNLQAGGAQGTVVRLGWEANLGSGPHPWGVDRPDQVPAYIACWRSAALALKAGGPAINLEWTNAKQTLPALASMPGGVLAMYPGDDVVDLWGVHYYDTGPQKTTQAVWDAYYGKTWYGGPWGLGTWLQAAKARGKKLAVGEWGVWANGQNTVPDNPLYVDNMYRTFKANAPDIAYETYFDNMTYVHQLCPGTAFPASTAMYKADWGRG